MIALLIAALFAFALICVALAVRLLNKRSSGRPTSADAGAAGCNDGMRPAVEPALVAHAINLPVNREDGVRNSGTGPFNRAAAERVTLRARVGAIEHTADSIADSGKDTNESNGQCTGLEAERPAAGSGSAYGRSGVCSDEPAADSADTGRDPKNVPQTAADDASTSPTRTVSAKPYEEPTVRTRIEPSLRDSEPPLQGETSESESIGNDARRWQAIECEGEQSVLPPPPASEVPPSGEGEGQPDVRGQAIVADANVAGAEANEPETESIEPIRTEADTGRAQVHATRPRTPRQFRPAPRAVRQPRTAGSETSAGPAFDRALQIGVRLTFEKADYCRISLLARRSSTHPIELAISGSGDPQLLFALQDEWFQDFLPADAGHLLRQGVEWSGLLPDGEVARWSLSGRELYVLAPHDDLYGFVSTARLVIGEEHVVLCTMERLREVSEAIAQSGSQPPMVLNSGKGIPAGWVALRGVLPRTPVLPNIEGDILDALRPLAEVQIALEGGIRLERQAWLTGYPPRIRLRGDIQSAGALRIDDIEATVSTSGSYSVPGWDQPGQHFVSCVSTSRSYAIREGAEDWQGWDAYRWSMGDVETDTVSVARRPAICGAAVRPPAARTSGRPLVIPVANMVLIGPNPGDIEICGGRADLHSAISIGFPSFDPVWAIPADPLRSDKRVARIRLIGTAHYPGGEHVPDGAPRSRAAVRESGRRDNAWRNLILSAGRKGLLTEPQSVETAELWRAYKKRARAMWRQR